MAGIVEDVRSFTVGPARVRVVTDCANDISWIVQAEEHVIRTLVDQDLWPHETVTLFVLDDFTPLVDQLKATGRLVEDALTQLPQRPMVNLYNPRQAAECFVFVNRQIMRAEGFWGDGVAAEGLLAHEHAHPLSEAPASAAARQLRVESEGPAALAPLAAQLGQTLSVGAVTELLANRFCLSHGFAGALGHVDGITLSRTVANLSQRAEVERRARAATAAGTLPAEEAQLLLRLADAQISLPFALEIVPFAQAGHSARAEELERLLTERVFAAIAPELTGIYRDLRALFVQLHPEWGPAAVEAWCADILARLSDFFSQGEARLTLRLANDTGSPP